ncbi:MAG TPA: cobaltochelatase subunit CobN, partial [Chloroflexota bacterium]|nr:cobaltochelatase subunit CobN [Chloroflexota bacterium]
MTTDQRVAELLDHLREIEERLIPTGLHVLDEAGDLRDAVALAAEHHPPEVIAQLEADLQRLSESDAIVRTLGGRYVRPSSGGDVIRNPKAVPTGRNLHGLNPALVPNSYALRQAHRTVDLLLARAST